MTTRVDEASASRVLERLHAAVNAHDAAAVAALCAEQVVWSDPAAPEPLRGRDAVFRFHRDVMFRAIPDVQIEVIEGPYRSTDGTRVAVRLRIRGTMTGPLTPPGFGPTGGPIAFETAEFSHIEAGLIARQTVVLDMLDLARQISAVPKADSLAGRIGVWLQRVASRRLRRRRR